MRSWFMRDLKDSGLDGEEKVSAVRVYMFWIQKMGKIVYYWAFEDEQ